MSAPPSHHVCMVLPERFPPDVRVEKEIRALTSAGHEVTLLCRGGADEPRRERIDVSAGRRTRPEDSRADDSARADDEARPDGGGTRTRSNAGEPSVAAGGESRADATAGTAMVDLVRLRRADRRERLAATASAAVNVAAGVHPRWERAMRRTVDRVDATALHVHDLPLVRTAIRAGRATDVPVVADLHENYPEAVRQWRQAAPPVREAPLAAAKRIAVPIARLKRRERRAVAGADRVLTVASEARKHYLQDCDADPGDVRVVSNTVDLEAFAREATGRRPADGPEPAADPERFTAAYVGGFGPHRGLETAIESLATADDGVELLLVGDGPTADDLRDLAAERGVAGRVTFTGWVDFEAVPAYIAASDACLVPHASTPHTETTIPHKLFQYMATGTPVVVSDLDPLARVVDRTAAGRIVPAGDPEALGETLSALAADPATARRLGETGRQAVEAEYHWERDAKRLRDVYAELGA